ncbi:DUF4249 family protein [Ekhidna sp.]
MKNTIPYFIIFIVFIGCTEPFELGKPKAILDVVDGKISTLEGQSYIRIFQQVDDSVQIPVPDLTISVISDKGDISLFRYKSGVYIPQESNFKGEVGTRYKMEAFNSDIMIESSFDSIPQPIPLSMALVDTFASILTPLNLIQKLDAVAAIAKIPSQTERRYTRLRFELTYLDFFSSEIDTTSFDKQYALYSCESNNGCSSDTTKVPVGLTTQQTWLFVNDSNPDCLNREGEVDLSNGCVPTCCRLEDDWNTEFKVYLESMSFSSYVYWEQIQQLTNNNGLIFDTFPFPISGNISCIGCQNEVVGLFRTVAETSATENRIL